MDIMEYGEIMATMVVSKILSQYSLDIRNISTAACYQYQID